MLHDPSRDLRLRIDTLEEENRQLKERIAALTGRAKGDKEVFRARKVFGLSNMEAALFLLLLRRGQVSYEDILDALYDQDHLAMISDPNMSIRTYIKRVREKTRPFGVEINTVYSLGFEMDEGTRILAVRAMSA